MSKCHSLTLFFLLFSFHSLPVHQMSLDFSTQFPNPASPHCSRILPLTWAPCPSLHRHLVPWLVSPSVYKVTSFAPWSVRYICHVLLFHAASWIWDFWVSSLKRSSFVLSLRGLVSPASSSRDNNYDKYCEVMWAVALRGRTPRCRVPESFRESLCFSLSSNEERSSSE